MHTFVLRHVFKYGLGALLKRIDFVRSKTRKLKWVKTEHARSCSIVDATILGALDSFSKKTIQFIWDSEFTRAACGPAWPQTDQPNHQLLTSLITFPEVTGDLELLPVRAYARFTAVIPLWHALKEYERRQLI